MRLSVLKTQLFGQFDQLRDGGIEDEKRTHTATWIDVGRVESTTLEHMSQRDNDMLSMKL